MDNIRCVIIGRVSDKKLLLQYIPDKKNKTLSDDFKRDSDSLLMQIIYPNKRKSEYSQYGVWHALYDDNLICYAVLTETWNSLELPFKMLKEIKKEIYDKFPDMQFNSDNSDISLAGAKIFLVDICKKYNNSPKHDKLAQAQAKMEQVAARMKKNVDHLHEQETKIAELEKNTQNVESNAQIFTKDSKKPANIMKMRNMKIYCTIGCFILAVLLYIFVPIIARCV
jgi:hypothetical protein